MQAGKEFVLLDAGHINFNVALYCIESMSPKLRFHEKAGNAPGSELISVIFHELLKTFILTLNLRLSLFRGVFGRPGKLILHFFSVLLLTVEQQASW